MASFKKKIIADTKKQLKKKEGHRVEKFEELYDKKRSFVFSKETCKATTKGGDNDNRII